jgi:hypothetical protein
MNIPLFVPDLDLLTEWEATEVRRLFVSLILISSGFLAAYFVRARVLEARSCNKRSY